MLAYPNVKQIMPKVGNRYESALAIAKRARNIEVKRNIENDRDLREAVDVAAKEIANGEVLVKINGEYCVLQEKKIDTSNIVKE